MNSDIETTDRVEIAFPHNQSAHCESGVTANLLAFYGRSCTEAFAFGLGEGLFFGYLPFIRVNKLPLTTYRAAVGGILKKAMRRFGVTLCREKFKNPADAMADLDAKLAEGVPVGCQTGAYWLTYFPPAFRFHFNMHNLVVYGRDGDEYLVSDPVFEFPNRISRKDLQRARYARGALAPNGSRYYVAKIEDPQDMGKELRLAIRNVARVMTSIPLQPFVGTRGIKFLASRLEKWPDKLGEEQAELHLEQLIRMQEEIGTGGGGFRFMYAAFLQEAASYPGLEGLDEFSERLTHVGDDWRRFAAAGSRICKHRPQSDDTYQVLAELVRSCGVREDQIFKDLLRYVR